MSTPRDLSDWTIYPLPPPGGFLILPGQGTPPPTEPIVIPPETQPVPPPDLGAPGEPPRPTHPWVPPSGPEGPPVAGWPGVPGNWPSLPGQGQPVYPQPPDLLSSRLQPRSAGRWLAGSSGKLAVSARSYAAADAQPSDLLSSGIQPAASGWLARRTG